MYGESINVKNSNLMYQYNQYTILNNLTLHIWLCVHVHQISDHTSSLTIVAVETKTLVVIQGLIIIIITLYLICKRPDVTKRYSL